MPRYRFDHIAINSTEKRKPTESDMTTYIGLEHMDSHSLTVKRWGSDVPIIGDKLVMKKGDVLLGKRNAYLRRAAIAPFDGLFSAHGMVLRPKTDVVDKDFFPIFIASDYFFDEAIRISVGSLSPTINWKDLKDVEFNLPTLDEQRKLAKILWAIIKTTNSYQEMLEKQDLLIKSQFIEMFGDVSKNDKSLKECLFGDYVSKMNLGPFGSDLKNDCFVEKEYGDCMVYEQKHAIEKTMDLPTRYITKEKHEKLKKFEVKSGDILVSCRGTIGQCYIIPRGSPVGVIHPSLMMIRPKSTVNTRFLLFLLEDILSRQDEQGSGVKMAIKASELSKIKTINPGIELQNRFFEIIEQIDKSKFEIEKSLNEITKLYQKIIRDSLKV